jgi:hypothetical protein
MPSFCHGLPLPCAKDNTSWIEALSQDSSSTANIKSESSDEESDKDKSKDAVKESDKKKSHEDNRNLQIASIGAALRGHPSSKDRCLNPHHVVEMMVII